MKKYDIVIIGGGPAGLSAAVWAADLGLSAAVIQKGAEFGGQLLETHNPITNYLGAPAAHGSDLRDRMLEHAGRFSFDRMLLNAVVAIDPNESLAVLEDGERVRWKSLIVATGVRRRKLEVEGEDEFRNRGVLGSGSLEREKARGKKVVIVGGGDAAMENALILGKYAESVTVVHRRDRFSARKEFLDTARLAPNVEFVTDARVTAIKGADRVEQVEIVGRSHPQVLNADLVLVRIGVVPNSEFVAGIVELDDAGYIRVNERAETSAVGIFACGDVANPMSPTIATATGTAATAVKVIKSLRR
jgi:thioredoxin reductase (NADPH)